MCLIMIFIFLVLLSYHFVWPADERKREEKDEWKRKYNARWNDEVVFIFCFCFLNPSCTIALGDGKFILCLIP